MDAADFVVRLIDRCTAPARKISAAFAGIEKSLKPVTGSKAFKALDAAGDKLFDFGKAAFLVGGAIAVGVSAALTKASIDAAIFRENSALAFEQLTGSAALGKKAFDTVRTLVGDLGLDLHQTTEGFRELLAAQFSIERATGLTKMVADLSVIGVTGEKAGRILTALTQIKAKGKLQQEEMLQLAEAGISLELVLGALQKGLGKTLPEIQKLQQAGEITGEQGLAAIEEAVKQKLHITEFGQARKKFIQTNLQGMIDALKSQGQLFFDKLGGSIADAAEAMKPLLQDTTAWVKGLDSSSITEVVKSVLATLMKIVPLAREFISGFIGGLGILGRSFSLDIDSTSLESARNAGLQFAEALGTILTIVRTVGGIVLWFATSPVGKVIAGFALFLIVAAKVITIVTAIAAVWGPVAGAMATVGAFLTGTLIPIMTYLGGIFVAFVASIGAIPLAIAAVLIGIGVLIYTFWDEIDAFFGGIPGRWLQYGKDMIAGLVSGIIAGTGQVWEAAKAVAQSALDAVKSTLGIGSPSKEMEKLAMFGGEGMKRGFEKSEPRIQSAASGAMAGGAMAGAASASGGGGQTSVALMVNVDGSGKDERKIAEEVIALAEERLVFSLERLSNPSSAPA